MTLCGAIKQVNIFYFKIHKIAHFASSDQRLVLGNNVTSQELTLPWKHFRCRDDVINIITILSQTFGPNSASVSGKYPVNELEGKHSLSFKIISRRKGSHQLDDMSNSVSVLDLTFNAII